MARLGARSGPSSTWLEKARNDPLFLLDLLALDMVIFIATEIVPTIGAG